MSAGVLSVSRSGTCLVTATKAGDGNYNSASSPQTAVAFGTDRSGAAVADLDERNLRNGTDADDHRRIGNGRRFLLGGGWNGVGMLGHGGEFDRVQRGTCLVTATKAADNDYNAVSSQSTTVSIAQAPQSITFTSQPPAQPQVGGGYTVAATADSGLPVAFSIDPASDTESARKRAPSCRLPPQGFASSTPTKRATATTWPRR